MRRVAVQYETSAQNNQIYRRSNKYFIFNPNFIIGLLLEKPYSFQYWFLLIKKNRNEGFWLKSIPVKTDN